MLDSMNDSWYNRVAIMNYSWFGGEQMKIDSIKIKLLMAEQEINQADLAERCEVSRQSVSCLLRCGSCTTKTAGKIAKALGVPVREIIKED